MKEAIGKQGMGCRVLVVQAVLMLVLLGVPFEARGQDAACTSAIEEAESQYQSGNFDVAIRQLYECLIQEEVSQENVIAGHRLLALAYLRKDDLDNARLTIVRLLGQAPEYTPDAVQNPPAYVSLVQNVKDQLQVQSEAAPEPERRVEPRRTGELLVEGGAGLTQYGGDRGYPSDNLFNEFREGAGLALELKVSYPFSAHLSGGISYLGGAFPELINNKEGFENIDEATSSRWVHTVGLFGVARFLPQAPVVPYAQLGVTSAYTRKNEVLRAGIGPQIGLGAAVPVTGNVGFFAEATSRLLFPGDALDLADEGNGFDPILTITAGLRYRIQGL